MLRLILVLMLLFLASCTNEPDFNVIKSNFNANITSFEKLSEMVKSDSKIGTCFEVGKDKIGEYYEYNDLWGDDKLTLEKVLEIYSISSSRYVEYRNLFEVTKTERVGYCNRNNLESYYLLAHRSGLSVSGCVLEISKKLPIPASVGKRDTGEDFSEVTILKDGWFMEYSCT